MRALLAILVATTFAIKVPLLASVALQTNTSGAMEDVVDLLRELRNSNDEEQRQANDRNVAEEAECASTLAALNENVNQANEEWSHAKNHLKYVQDELKTTQDHIANLKERLDRNNRKLDELAGQRCHENAKFVKSLREHKEALAVLELLRADIDSYFATGAGDITELIEKVQKLAPKHLFAQIKQGKIYLAYGEDFYKVSYDSNSAEEHHDNDRDVIKTTDTSSVVGQRKDTSGDLHRDLDDLIDQLEDHLYKSLEDYEDAEIKSAYDFADWQDATEKENQNLSAELQRKQDYETKLVEDLEKADNYEKLTHSAYDNAVAALNAKEAECEHKKNYFQTENERRASENEAIDAALEVLYEAMPELQNYTKSRAGGVEEAATPTRRIYDYSIDRADYEETGGYSTEY